MTSSKSNSGPVWPVKHRLKSAVLRTLMAGPGANFLVSGPLPDRLAFPPQDPEPGQLEIARQILKGDFVAGGQSVQLDESPPWDVTPPNPEWYRAIHRFDWLRHLAAAGGAHATGSARILLTGWVERYGEYDRTTWQPELLGPRVLSWFRYFRLLFENTDLVGRSRAMVSLARQARYLVRIAPYSAPGRDRLSTLIPAVYVALCLKDEKHRLAAMLDNLIDELDVQINEDGGHVSRNPELTAGLLLELAVLREDLQSQKERVPDELETTIGQMAGFIRLMSHGDGRLACFNGGGEGENAIADRALALAEGEKRTPERAEITGYERLHQRRTTVLMDTGAAPPIVFGKRAQAGCLSFEMSAGRGRILVNCGPAVAHGADWQRLLRASAAHTTLIAADHSSAKFVDHRDGRYLTGPTGTKVTRTDRAEGCLVEGRHEGYGKQHGIAHERRLFLSVDGNDLRGEDRLVPLAGKKGPEIPFTLRFHLYPGIKASALPNGTILLKTPAKEGWTMRSDAGVLTLEESIYIGSGNRLRRTEQIVLSGLTQNLNAQIRWALRRNDKSSSSEDTNKPNKDPAPE